MFIIKRQETLVFDFPHMNALGKSTHDNIIPLLAGRSRHEDDVVGNYNISYNSTSYIPMHFKENGYVTGLTTELFVKVYCGSSLN